MMITRRAVVLLSVLALAACARAEGSSLPERSEVDTAVATSDAGSVEEEPPIEYIPADVDPDAIAPIIDYVDALNIALTGDLFALRASANPGCGCLAIADRLAQIFPSQTLIGGHYQLKQIHLISDGGFVKEFEVLVHRSDIEKIDKQSRVSVLWSESQISTIFNIKYNSEVAGGAWQLSDTR
jgi:hypothetical protein